MNLNSLRPVIARLRRGKHARKQFVESHLNKTLAYQIRAIRDRLGWSQEKMAQEVGMNQNAISRLESPEYGKLTLTTLKRLAAAFDVGLVVRFVPFGELTDWVTGTPRTIKGLNTDSLAVADFDTEEQSGVFDRALRMAAAKPQLAQLGFEDFVPSMAFNKNLRGGVLPQAILAGTGPQRQVIASGVEISRIPVSSATSSTRLDTTGNWRAVA